MQVGRSQYATMGRRVYEPGALPSVVIAATTPGGGVVALGRGPA